MKMFVMASKAHSLQMYLFLCEDLKRLPHK